MFYFDGVKGKEILPSYSDVSFIEKMGASAVKIPFSKPAMFRPSWIAGKKDK